MSRLMRSALPALLGAAATCLASAAPAGAVVGGTPAKPSSYPWHAELPFCGGALIAPDRVATAAHCVAGLPLRDIHGVRLGSGVVRQAVGISIEPGYLRRALDGSANRDAPAGDVAIVVLDAPVPGVKPLTVRTRTPTRGTPGLLLGSGQKTVPRKPVRAAANFESLRKATLGVISDGACGAFYRRHGGKAYRSALRPATMLCATDPDGRRPFRSACVGDSGGPLVIGSTLAGIVSWGLRCGGDRDPSVFTDPTAYRAFLTAPSPALAPVSSGAPATISGEAKVGATLTCAAPPWVRAPSSITFSFDSYRFNHGRTSRQQGASPTYVVRAADAGRYVSCAATGSNAGGFETTRASADLRIAA
ncbi:MAG: trypsin [Solirubrobacteraceae bacterium]|nr:trypsin [Solirubrobacteraceae bacterium]